MGTDPEPRVFGNRWADAVGAGGAAAGRELCKCFDQGTVRPQRRIRFHSERQDVTAPGWLRLLELVEEAAADQREVFKPLTDLTPDERRQVITLPETIAKLTAVKHLVLYGSNLVRIPPEVGAMVSLEEFSPYTSYRLHWFPYEIASCPNLRRSTVSTRAVYGNYKLRPPFPPLAPPTEERIVDLTNLDPAVWGTVAIKSCSVCAQPVDVANLRQAWISLRVATDVVPLLVNACSETCIEALPQSPENYVQGTHLGGPTVQQPPAGYAFR